MEKVLGKGEGASSVFMLRMLANQKLHALEKLQHNVLQKMLGFGWQVKLPHSLPVNVNGRVSSLEIEARNVESAS